MRPAVFNIFFNCLALLSLLPASLATAQSFSSFDAAYEATYRGINATAYRALTSMGEERYLLETSVQLKLLGATLTSIKEESFFTWDGNTVRPYAYEYNQSGLGSRSRKVEFDWEAMTALAEVNGKTTELTLDMDEPVFDELSVYPALRKRLAAGEEEVELTLVEEDRLEHDKYRVIGEEPVETGLGRFETIKVEKVRPPENTRITRFWLAKDKEYMLVKLFQRDGKGRDFTITLTEATLNGKPLTAE